MNAAQSLHILANLFAQSIDWAAWEGIIESGGITIDRPAGQPHPAFPEIIYPMDYGFVPGTRSSDGEPVDVFVGTGGTGLQGAILTHDYRQKKREVKLLLDCSPKEVYTAHGFINFDRSLLEGVLVLREPMHLLWEKS